MRTKNIYTLLTLILLTVLTAICSTQFSSFMYVSVIIMALSALKFGLITFNFMELYKANTLWKVLIIAYLLIFVSAILLVL